MSDKSPTNVAFVGNDSLLEARLVFLRTVFRSVRSDDDGQFVHSVHRQDLRRLHRSGHVERSESTQWGLSLPQHLGSSPAGCCRQRHIQYYQHEVKESRHGRLQHTYCSYLYLYSALYVVPHTEGAQVWITQCYLQLHQCLPLPRKRSPDGASPDWGRGHLIAAYYSFIYPERMNG